MKGKLRHAPKSQRCWGGGEVHRGFMKDADSSIVDHGTQRRLCEGQAVALIRPAAGCHPHCSVAIVVCACSSCAPAPQRKIVWLLRLHL